MSVKITTNQVILKMVRLNNNAANFAIDPAQINVLPHSDHC